MITITNVSKKYSPVGEQTYEVRVTEHGAMRLVTTFKHTRVDGMPTCLKKAGEAVERKQALDLVEFIRETQEQNGKG